MHSEPSLFLDVNLLSLPDAEFQDCEDNVFEDIGLGGVPVSIAFKISDE